MQSLAEKIRAEEPKPTFADLHTTVKQPERSQRECYDMGFRKARDNAVALAEQWEREQLAKVAKCVEEAVAGCWAQVNVARRERDALQAELAEVKRDRDEYRAMLILMGVSVESLDTLQK